MKRRSSLLVDAWVLCQYERQVSFIVCFAFWKGREEPRKEGMAPVTCFGRLSGRLAVAIDKCVDFTLPADCEMNIVQSMGGAWGLWRDGLSNWSYRLTDCCFPFVFLCASKPFSLWGSVEWQ